MAASVSIGWIRIDKHTQQRNLVDSDYDDIAYVLFSIHRFAQMCK